ncbi:phospho-sugar mutase [Amnibacterium kyonggiense]|uniref:Phosphomannomutase n=1 Tax=Amnibacterium kyonggiense TaxID=595671 RepID=A0A4R7FH55_9MICO|nr:phospho-sugar mutase [Amnibacterium kyonggiense]TDS75010.1 phosphomannomutase [Amnibacterium kyonggiense]
MTDLGALEAAARAWLAIDPDPVTRAETEALLAAGDERGLADRFDGRLEFGTAGLRGALGAGPLRMNRVVVRQTTAGLARFLLAREPRPTAVVGYDGRRNSKVFAEDAAAVLAAAGVAATLLPAALPTPVLAFAVRDLGASAGVMITASHNPAPDNGYKLYLGGEDAGSQLVSPADREVLVAIEAAVADGAGADGGDPSGVVVAGEEVLYRYVAATAGLATPSGTLPWVYTPMHGVGLATVRRVLARTAFDAPSVVPEQAQPDPDFPTAPFPNPEEPGTLDLATALADREGAALVLANDPDADRLAVAVRTPEGWRRLSGNEVGLLLGWRIASRSDVAGGSLASSIVSTPGLARIAERFGFLHVETLTGFKWISRVPGMLFGFEEALGYLVDPDVVRDKDGISALVAVLSTAHELAGNGRTLLDLLGEIEEAIGRFDSDQVSIRVDDLRALGAMTARLRADPPTAIGGLEVLEADDLSTGDAGLPPTDALRYRLASGARMIVRPSGTEPKLKVYLDVVSEAPTAPERAAATARTLDALRAAVRPLLSI